MTDSWTVDELLVELERYEAELIEAGKKDSTVITYVDRAKRFVRWLDGEYAPQ